MANKANQEERPPMHPSTSAFDKHPEQSNLAQRYSYTGIIVNQGIFPTCWAVSVTSCADSLRQLHLIQNRSPVRNSDRKKRFSPQEIINYYHKNIESPHGVKKGYKVWKAIEYIQEQGIPWIQRCPYIGILDRKNTRISHICPERLFPFKSDVYDHFKLKHGSQGNYKYRCRIGLSGACTRSVEQCDADIESILRSRPLILSFAVGIYFSKLGSSEIYDPEREKQWTPRFVKGLDNFDRHVQDGPIDILGLNPSWNEYNEVSFHAMVAVDCGVEGDQKFWVVKNSAGPKWGDGGYGRILRCHRRNPFVSASVPYFKD